MSASLAPAAGVPPVNQALEPAAVRNGSPATQKAYASALDFESMLVQQLSQSLAQASESGESEGESGEGGEGGGGGGSEAANGELSSLLPQALTEGVMSQGGLGLAQQLMPALDPSAPASSTPASSTSAPTTPAPSAPVKVASSGGVAT